MKLSYLPKVQARRLLKRGRQTGLSRQEYRKQEPQEMDRTRKKTYRWKKNVSAGKKERCLTSFAFSRDRCWQMRQIAHCLVLLLLLASFVVKADPWLQILAENSISAAYPFDFPTSITAAAPFSNLLMLASSHSKYTKACINNTCKWSWTTRVMTCRALNSNERLTLRIYLYEWNVWALRLFGSNDIVTLSHLKTTPSKRKCRDNMQTNEQLG